MESYSPTYTPLRPMPKACHASEWDMAVLEARGVRNWYQPLPRPGGKLEDPWGPAEPAIDPVAKAPPPPLSFALSLSFYIYTNTYLYIYTYMYIYRYIYICVYI